MRTQTHTHTRAHTRALDCCNFTLLYTSMPTYVNVTRGCVGEQFSGAIGEGDVPLHTSISVTEGIGVSPH